jgi:hypothetical protein
MAEAHCIRCSSLQHELDMAHRKIEEQKRQLYELQEVATRLQHYNEKLSAQNGQGYLEGRSWVNINSAGKPLWKKGSR